MYVLERLKELVHLDDQAICLSLATWVNTKVVCCTLQDTPVIGPAKTATAMFKTPSRAMRTMSNGDLEMLFLLI